MSEYDKCDPIITLNEKSQRLITYIKIITAINSILIIIKIFIIPNPRMMITEFIGTLLLFITFNQANYKTAAFSIIYLLYPLLRSFLVVAQFVQNYLFSLVKDIDNITLFCAFTSVFYIVAICVVFQAYKEFKALKYNYTNYQTIDDDNDDSGYENEKKYNYVPFSGRGMMVGGA